MTLKFFLNKQCYTDWEGMDSLNDGLQVWNDTTFVVVIQISYFLIVST